METEKVLNFSCEMGRQLLQNGAEIYRVEESIHRLLEAYGCQQIEVFAIPSCIILNIQEGEHNYTKSVRIKGASIDLQKLGLLNALCREICGETPTVEESWERLQEILDKPIYSARVSYLAYGFVAFFFTLFWGGNWLDAVVAFPCGLLVKAVSGSMRRARANVFFTNLVTSMLLALGPLLLAKMGMSIRLDKIIIGTIMLLVPGVAITNVMRDVLAGDFLTALTRFAEVLIVALGITVGVAMAITGVRMLAMGI